MIPQFPEFKKLEITDRDEILAVTKDFPPYSDFDFGSLWSWDFSNSMEISRLNENFVIKFTDYLSGEYFYTFIGSTLLNETAETLIKHAKEIGIMQQLKLIPQVVLDKLNPNLFETLEDPDNTDYVILVDELKTYEGHDFAAKRRAVSQFERKNYNYNFQKIDLTSTSVREDIDRLFILWHTQKIEDGVEAESTDSSHEYIAMNRCITSSETLNLDAYGLYVEGKMIAFWILGMLGAGYSISHFEKADIKGYQGVFPFFKKFVAVELAKKGIKAINLEQDLGIPGLRQSKNAYFPKEFLKKYIVSLK